MIPLPYGKSTADVEAITDDERGGGVTLDQTVIGRRQRGILVASDFGAKSRSGTRMIPDLAIGFAFMRQGPVAAEELSLHHDIDCSLRLR